MFISVNGRLLSAGFLLWVLGTAGLRLAGDHLLHPGDPRRTLLLFAGSLPLMAWVVRRLCRRAGLPREAWLEGAVSVALPTLLLDPFSSAFFQVVFPNMPSEAAGIFGGWMLVCCAGAVLGALLGGQRAH